MSKRVNTTIAKTAQDLIYTTNYVNDSVTMREVRTWFHTQPKAKTLAVVSKGDDFGVITRERLNQCLLESPSPEMLIRDQPDLISDALKIDARATVQEMMDEILARHAQNENFFDDVIVHSGDQFMGLASMRDVVVSQLNYLMHRVSALEAQQASLAKQNKELFENSFRQGQKETQFRSFFDQAPLPIIVFDNQGRFLAATQRFFRFTDYTPKQIDSQYHFNRLFADSFEEVTQAVTTAEENENPVRLLTIIPASKITLNVHAVVEISPDWGHVIVSIIGMGEKGRLAAPEIIASTAPKAISRITQAIRNKVAEEQAKGLARSVASNLIDREDQIELLMKKLEKIFEISNKIEQFQEPEIIHENEGTEDQHLKGNLAEFSIVDLCQILVQGTKTGQLVIYLPEAPEKPAAYIYFYCGSIVHAKHQDGFVGVDALAPILSIRKGTFDFLFNRNSPENTISGDPMGLLMDACRKVDEKK